VGKVFKEDKEDNMSKVEILEALIELEDLVIELEVWVEVWVEEWAEIKQVVEEVEAIIASFIILVNIPSNKFQPLNHIKGKNHNKEVLKIKETKCLICFVEIFIKISSANSDKLAGKNIHLCLMTKIA
jgi:hypothetical protein